MLKLREMMKRKERGSAELVVTLITVPLLIALLFAIVNVSSYFQVRSEIQNEATNGSRLVALYGGSSTGAYRNTTGQSVQNIVLSKIYSNGKCTYSYCAKKPTVSCYVVVNGAKVAVAREAGQEAVCTITYTYSPVAPITLGFNGLFNIPVNVSATSVTETGYN